MLCEKLEDEVGDTDGPQKDNQYPDKEFTGSRRRAAEARHEDDNGESREATNHV